MTTVDADLVSIPCFELSTYIPRMFIFVPLLN